MMTGINALADVRNFDKSPRPSYRSGVEVRRQQNQPRNMRISDGIHKWIGRKLGAFVRLYLRNRMAYTGESTWRTKIARSTLPKFAIRNRPKVCARLT